MSMNQAMSILEGKSFQRNRSLMYINWYISDQSRGLKMRSFGGYIIENDEFIKMQIGWGIVKKYQ